MNHIEAMKQAIEHMEWSTPQGRKAYWELVEAIATEESSATQEPVGFYDAENKDLRREIPMGEDGDWWQPVYTHQQPKAEPKREWVGLTDEDRRLVRKWTTYNQYMTASEYAEAVQIETEKALKEKNT